MTTGCPGDQTGQPGLAQAGQAVGVCARLQEHGQVGVGQIAGQRAERQELPNQVLEARLVDRAEPGQTIAHTHPAIESRMFMTAQLEREQALRADDGQHGQGQCVDAGGLGVAGQKATKVVGLCRADAVDEVAAADEVDGDGPPCRDRWPP